METFEGLSLWPWFLAAAHSFAATIFFAPRLLRGASTSHLSALFYIWSLGGAAAIAVLVGVIEKANAGLLAGRGTSDMVEMIAVLALFGALAGIVPMIGAIKLPTSQHKKPDGN